MAAGLFTSSDGTMLEIELLRAAHERACIVLWPCMGGSFRMYRFPARDFAAQGFSSIQFNPRGHGESEGQLSIQSAVKDLDYFLSLNGLLSGPLVGIGHSAGANALLQYSSLNEHFTRFFLVAPVLDSRMSLEYLYGHGNINEFNSILAMRAGTSGVIDELLGDSRWMDPVCWEKNRLRDYMDSRSAKILIGTFLEDLFIPGHNAYSYLKDKAGITEVILAAEDHWYPLEETKRLAGVYGFALTEIARARDHFFTRAWSLVWEHVLERLGQ